MTETGAEVMDKEIERIHSRIDKLPTTATYVLVMAAFVIGFMLILMVSS